MTAQKTLVTRQEVREMGLNVTSTQFLRYENDELLTPLKPGGRRSARVHYRIEQVEALLRMPRHVKLSHDAS